MGLLDVLVIIAWVLVVVILCVAASVMMGADWREWVRTRRGARHERMAGRD